MVLKVLSASRVAVTCLRNAASVAREDEALTREGMRVGMDSDP